MNNLSFLINFLIGLVTSLFILFLFKKFEKKRINLTKKTKYLFACYVSVCSIVYEPSQSTQHLLLWIGIMFLLYSILDDALTSTLDSNIPIIVTILFFIILQNPYHLFLSFCVFIVFLLFCKLTKEQYIGEGDAYLLLPLLLLTEFQYVFSSFYISFLLAIIVLTAFEFRSRKKEYAFGPFLVTGFLLVISRFYIEQISGILTLLFFFCAPLVLYLSIKKEK